LALGNIAFQAGIVLGIVLLHEAVTIGAGPVKDVVRVLIHVVEVNAHGFEEVFADDLRKLPAPLGVEVGIGDHVKGGLLGDVGGGHGLGCGVFCGIDQGDDGDGGEQPRPLGAEDLRTGHRTSGDEETESSDASKSSASVSD